MTVTGVESAPGPSGFGFTKSKGAKWIALIELVLSVAWLMSAGPVRPRARLHRLMSSTPGAPGESLPGSERPIGLSAQAKISLRIEIAVPVATTIGCAAFFIALRLDLANITTVIQGEADEHDADGEGGSGSRATSTEGRGA